MCETGTAQQVAQIQVDDDDDYNAGFMCIIVNVV
jgi:hypothetical protein